MFTFKFSRQPSNKVKVVGRDSLKIVPQVRRDWWWLVGAWCLGLLVVTGFGAYLSYRGNDLNNVSLIPDPVVAPTVGSRKVLDATVKVINEREAAFQQALQAPAVADPAR